MVESRTSPGAKIDWSLVNDRHMQLRA